MARPFAFVHRTLLLTLLSLPALAQQPVLAPLPAPPPAAPGTLPPPPAAPRAPALDSAAGGVIIGQTYNVELMSGTAFIGVLTVISPEELTCQSRDLGRLVIQRVNIKQLNLLTSEQARRNYDYIGNGSRLFFAPTARNLRRGEGTVQSINIFLLGVNYGVNNNLSVGALFTWIPAAGTKNLFALTPKASFPVRENLHVGGGAVVVFVGGESATLAYANTTFGSADSNFTAGVGYGFAGGQQSSTPVFTLGGITRVSRRVSLLNETYILNDNDGYTSSTLIAGIAGIRISGQRLSGGLGLLYLVAESDGFAVPSGEVTFRFGRVN